MRIGERLAEQPESGARYKRQGLRNLRRVRITGTPYLAFYHYEPGGEVVTILAVWSGTRKRGPKLTPPR